MEGIARSLGYGTSILLLAVLLWLLATLRGEFDHSRRVIRVRFQETGTLRPEDPVSKSGVTVGRVLSVAPDKQGALVEIELFDRQPLPADSRFVNFNHSLMGARMVVLVPGSSVSPLDENQVQTGLFANGVAETIHQVDELLRLVLYMDSLSGHWRAPSDSTGSWSGTLTRKIYPAMDEIRTLHRSLTQVRATLEPRLSALEKTSGDLYRLSRTVHGQTDSLMRISMLTLAKLDSLSDFGQRIIVEVDSLLLLAVGPNSALPPLILERTVYDRTLQLLETLKTALAILSSDGLEVIHGRNLHFFRGRAHSR